MTVALSTTSMNDKCINDLLKRTSIVDVDGNVVEAGGPFAVTR